VTSEGHFSQGGRGYTSGTIALQFVTAVTSGTVTLTISIKIAPRAGPKPAGPVISNVDSSLKKKKYTPTRQTKQRRGVQVYGTCV